MITVRVVFNGWSKEGGQQERMCVWLHFVYECLMSTQRERMHVCFGIWECCVGAWVRSMGAYVRSVDACVRGVGAWVHGCTCAWCGRMVYGVDACVRGVGVCVYGVGARVRGVSDWCTCIAMDFFFFVAALFDSA